MTHRDEYAERARFSTLASEWYAKKLAALKAGEFDFDDLTGNITFHDADLQRANY